MLQHLLSVILPLSGLLSAAEFKVAKSSFLLDDKPFHIRSGVIHYSRVPGAEWRSRIRMTKAMGLNTNSTYVFRNYHEAKLGEFDFSGEKDVAEFVRLCGADPPKGPLTVHCCKVKFGNPRDIWLDMRGYGRGMVWFYQDFEVEPQPFANEICELF